MAFVHATHSCEAKRSGTLRFLLYTSFSAFSASPLMLTKVAMSTPAETPSAETACYGAERPAETPSLLLTRNGRVTRCGKLAVPWKTAI